MRPEVTVLGAGAFGTCLAVALGKKGVPVYLWDRKTDLVAELAETRRHPTRLDGIELPEPVRPIADLEAALRVPMVIHAIAAQATRGFWTEHRELLAPEARVLLAAKGLERDSGLRLDEVFAEIFGPGWVHERLAALSGPTFAKELAAEMPTVAVIASRREAVARAFQVMMATPFFRLYVSEDLVGVEVAGAVKNVIAIAAGISDGLGFGLNSRAALITRGLAEIIRFGVAQGADPATFSGLAGVGDLVLTATGNLSRNRTLGLRIGKGERLEEILADMREVAEGVPTTQSTLERARRLGVELPIIEQVAAVLFEGKDPAKAVYELMTRTLKRE